MANVGSIPVYKLYGEQDPWPTPEMVHCESIASRSRLHNWHIKPHQHNGLFQILYLHSGSARIQLDDKQSLMQGGQVLMVPQICIHGFEFDRNTVGHVVTLAYPLISKLTRQMGDGLVALTHPSLHTLGEDEESAHIRMAFAALDAEYRATAPHRDILIEALLGAILVWLTRHAMQAPLMQHKEAPRGSRHVARFCELLEEHYSQHYPVAYYASQLGITAAHLNLLCRQNADKSALDLIHERVLLEAKRNLVYTSMTISEVSYAIGFSDPAYFTRFFKRSVGQSPKDFRRQAGT
ncbi:helix-turn-helix domain-containing protein [Noviherbaspirillum saxi]|uniref:Helix-turn-helix domain-containing protein n=1 Tax=Noviherbaspirillum saxi TaxID=2320863 RepID=A0A3A3FUH2_9BURK|nr:helix-turn-helix domain-containing protein [Noviherbaspirillum saxi]RJF99190.1 helix-turn-helix domain-containing protein [Noviherbaspirillum saxi]